MDSKLKTKLAGAIDLAHEQDDLTLQERVARNILGVWKQTRQNTPYKLTDAEAAALAFNAQKKETTSRNARLNVQVDVPAKQGYAHAEFKSFDNAMVRVRTAIINAPHAIAARVVVDGLVKEGVVSNPNLVIAKAMEAVAGGTAKVAEFETAKRDTHTKSTTERAVRDAKAVTPEGFVKVLEAWGEKVTEKGLIFDLKALETLAASVKVAKAASVDKPTDAVVEPVVEPTADVAPMDMDEIKRMVGEMPQMMAAYAASVKLLAENS